MKRLYSLHYFRGFAAVSVVLYHITLATQDKFHYTFFWGIFRFGNIGVDFFFILSGFLLFYVHQNDRGNAKKVLLFFRKRIQRIAPTYWIIALVIVLISISLYTLPLPYTISPLFLLQEITLYPHDPRIIPQSWTLSLELYFYLFFGTFLLIKSKEMFLLSFALYIAGVFLISHFLFSNTNEYLLFLGRHPYLELLLSPYLGEFFLGCLAGWIFLKKKYQLLLSKKIFLFTCIPAAIFSFCIVGMQFHIPEFHRVLFVGMPLAYTVLAVSSFESVKGIPKNIIGTLLGNTSYSLYLSHLFLITAILGFITSPLPNSFSIFSLCIFLLLISLSISLLFTALIETPIQKFLSSL